MIMITCKDCNKTLKTRYSQRCYSCAAKKRVLDYPYSVLQNGNKHYAWKGDKVGYTGIHMWVYKTLGKPDTCEKCSKSGLNGKFINWANISGKYLREKDDWKRLCKPCHVKFDDIINKGWDTKRRQILL